MYKLLIAEDEAILREGVSEELEATGLFSVETAENGEIALDLTGKNDYDAILLDISMPKMDGLELLRRLNENGNKSLKIIMSGYSDFNYAQKAIEFGVIDYVVKPLTPTAIIGIAEKLGNALDERKNKEETISILKSQADSSKHILADMLMTRMINGEYSGSETEDKLRGVDVVFDSGSLSVLLIYPLKENERPQIGKKSVFLASSDTGAVVIDSESDDIDAIAKSLLSLTGEGGICAISNSHDDMERLSQAYDEAEETLKYARITGKSGVIKYIDVKNEGSNIYLDELEFQVQLGLANRDDLKAWVDKLFDNMHNAVIHDYYSLAVYISILCRNNILKITNGKSSLQIDIKEVMNAKNLDEIKEWIYKSINRTCDLINQCTWKRSVTEVEKTKEYIDEHLSEVITMADLARNAYLSPNYLGKLFQEKIGMSTLEYINRRRIEKACELLRQDNEMMMYEIAAKVGINDANYFSTLFKKIVGQSPKEYKRLAMLAKQK